MNFKIWIHFRIWILKKWMEFTYLRSDAHMPQGEGRTVKLRLWLVDGWRGEGHIHGVVLFGGNHLGSDNQQKINIETGKFWKHPWKIFLKTILKSSNLKNNIEFGCFWRIFKWIILKISNTKTSNWTLRNYIESWKSLSYRETSEKKN